jgi:hypothetical protein
MSLNSASFPQLTNIGGNLDFANNPQLTAINGFQSLQTVGGNIDLTGDFNQVSLPSLTNVGGGINIQTSSKNFTCPISSDRTNGVIQGKGFVCAGNITNPTPGVGANYTANTFPALASPSVSSGSFIPLPSGRSQQDSMANIVGYPLWPEIVLQVIMILYFWANGNL